MSPSLRARGAPCLDGRRPIPLACLVLFLGALASCRHTPAASPPESIERTTPTELEGTAHGFPALRDLDGKTLAAGDFTQWLEGDRLHIRIRYEFDSGRIIEERSVLRQEPLVQEQWSWQETRDGRVKRRFAVDFVAGVATAEKLEDGELHQWSKQVELTPGRAFTGSAFTLAIKSLRQQLLGGEAIELQTVGFTPKPRAARVELTHAGVDRLTMSGRTILGDHFIVHPKIPWIARPFVEVPDTQLWLVHADPAAFLRWEGPLGEPDGPIVRVDLLPGEPSGAAVPTSR